MSFLPDTMGFDIKAFERDPLCMQFYIDTSYCVTKWKRFNIKCMYKTFAEYCDLDTKGVKDLLIKEIEKSKHWFIKASAASLGMRSVSFEAWFAKLQRSCTWPNKYALYALCVVFRRNALVINAGQAWTNMQLQDDMSFDMVLEMCKTRLLYLGNNLCATLRQRPFTLERSLEVKVKDIQKSRQLIED